MYRNRKKCMSRWLEQWDETFRSLVCTSFRMSLSVDPSEAIQRFIASAIGFPVTPIGMRLMPLYVTLQESLARSNKFLCFTCGKVVEEKRRGHHDSYECRECRRGYDRVRQKTKYHTDPKWRERQLEYCQSYENRTNYMNNRYNSDPEFRKRSLDRAKRWRLNNLEKARERDRRRYHERKLRKAENIHLEA